jgi:ABC-2 type transport system ATP-binding protein
LREGEILGIIGPNGAGKSTLLRLLAGVLWPTSGTMRVLGKTIGSTSKGECPPVGWASADHRTFSLRLSGRENLRFFAGLNGLKGKAATERINTLIQQTGISKLAEKPFRNYSTGSRQWLAVARALLADPALLLLDEAGSGLDPGARKKLRTLLRNLAKEGKAIIYTSHDLHEVANLCTRVVIIEQGRIVSEGTYDEIERAALEIFFQSEQAE